MDNEVNIKWCGCLGDGSTNDSTGFATAEGYAQTNNFRLFIPAGTFLIRNSSLRCDVRGSGYDVSIIKQQADTADATGLFTASGSVEIQGVTIDGIKTTHYYSRWTITYNGTEATRLSVHNCKFINS